MEEKYLNIPKEKFEFANSGEKLSDTKFDTKPLSYFQDALLRFSKNRASVVATIIIVLIILYSFIVPLCTSNYKRTLMDVEYCKKCPRLVDSKNSLVFNGTITAEFNEQQFVQELAKGVGVYYDGTDSFEKSSTLHTIEYYLEDEMQPIVKVKKVESKKQGKNTATIFTAAYEEYYSVGFRYMDVEQSEYQKMLEWQEETGLQLIYPLIADNEYHYTNDNYNGANYWYKTTGKAVPVKIVDGEAVSLIKNVKSEEDVYSITLEENYMRDTDGNLVYHIYSGGGDFETAQYRIRILYYNYYIYKNGFEPSYLLGTDSTGYDLAYRMAKGIQLSLLLAVCVSVINFILGAMYGAVQGYYGGTVDIIMDRVSDILSGVPFMIVATLFQMHLSQKLGAVPCLIFAFVLTGWIGTAARVRTQFYRFKNQEYVMAARTLGAKDNRIIWKHIFPNTLGTIITSSALVIPSVIFSESMLSFLGIVKLGGSKFTSLGQLLSDASSIWTLYPHLMIYPALVISLLMICFNLFGNGLRDAFNPTLRGTEE